MRNPFRRRHVAGDGTGLESGSVIMVHDHDGGGTLVARVDRVGGGSSGTVLSGTVLGAGPFNRKNAGDSVSMAGSSRGHRVVYSWPEDTEGVTVTDSCPDWAGGDIRVGDMVFTDTGFGVVEFCGHIRPYDDVPDIMPFILASVPKEGKDVNVRWCEDGIVPVDSVAGNLGWMHSLGGTVTQVGDVALCNYRPGGSSGPIVKLYGQVVGIRDDSHCDVLVLSVCEDGDSARDLVGSTVTVSFGVIVGSVP